MSRRPSELLGSAHRPRELTGDERARLRERLQLEASDQKEEDNSRAGGAEVVELRPAPSEPQTHRPGSEQGWVLRVAAVVLLLVGVVVWSPWNERQVEVGNDPVSDGYQSVCGGEVEELIAGLESWRGVENWAFATSDAPDLPALLVAATDAVERIDPEAATMSATREQLRAGLASAGDGELPVLFEEATARETAMRAALDALVMDLSAQPRASTCRLDALVAGAR